MAKQELAARDLSYLRIAQLPPHSLPFQIPEEFQKLPRLNGRATVEMEIRSLAVSAQWANKRNGSYLQDDDALLPSFPYFVSKLVENNTEYIVVLLIPLVICPLIVLLLVLISRHNIVDSCRINKSYPL